MTNSDSINADGWSEKGYEMGCDVYYSCKQSDRENVKKLVNILCRLAQKRGSAYSIVDLPSKSLICKGRSKPVNLDLYGFVFTALWHEPVEEYPEMHSRSQFVFDFLRGGKLIKLVLPYTGLYQASENKIPCLLMEDGGYWRSIGNYAGFPRLLALFKVRYLPALDFWSDYGEADYFKNEICMNDSNREKLLKMSEDAFYEMLCEDYGN